MNESGERQPAASCGAGFQEPRHVRLEREVLWALSLVEKERRVDADTVNLMRQIWNAYGPSLVCVPQVEKPTSQDASKYQKLSPTNWADRSSYSQSCRADIRCLIQDSLHEQNEIRPTSSSIITLHPPALFSCSNAAGQHFQTQAGAEHNSTHNEAAAPDFRTHFQNILLPRIPALEHAACAPPTPPQRPAARRPPPPPPPPPLDRGAPPAPTGSGIIGLDK